MTTKTRLAGLLAALILLIHMVALSPAVADEVTTDPVAILDQQAAELAAIVKTDAGTEADLAEKAKLRDRVMGVGVAANAAVALLEPRLAAIDARIAELGAPSDTEAADIKAQRAKFAAERGDIDSAIKRGRLLAADAKETIDRLIREVNDAFNRDTFKNVSSPLSPNLWRDVARSLPDDSARLWDFVRDTVSDVPAAGLTSRLLVLAGGLGIGIVLLVPVRRWLRNECRRIAIEQVPGTRARRSALALCFVLLGTSTSALAFWAFFAGLNWADVVTRRTEQLAQTMTLTASIGGFVVSLGAALLLVGQPSWRLLPISDAAARRLRSYPTLCAVLTFLGVLLVEGGKTIGISQAAAIVANYIVAFTYSGLIVAVLVSLGRIRRREGKVEDGGEPNLRTTIVTLAQIVAWICVAVAIAAALQGYVNLALFLGRQTIWVAIVAAAAYLLLVVTDDLCTTLISGDGRLGQTLHRGLAIRKSQVTQFGVIASAILRIAVLFLALLVVTGPFGPGASSLFYQFGNSAELSLGGFTIVPGAILKAIFALVAGILVMRGVRHWLDERFLPTTDLDAGARNSVSTIVNYAGILFAGFLAISALGIGIERIALVVSALSVGIGFGLQAITQNFISGLILLTERPVKIGDTVRIGSDEGDVKRISVRSTEIQIADRSTLIVPNSELITKTIRNMTLANPLGRIQISFAAPLDVDVVAVRKALLDIFADHSAVLDDPDPSVFIDGIVGGQVTFNAFAFVSGPRAVYATRSSILFALLDRLRRDGIELVPPVVPPASDAPA